ncbi:MAG: DUF1501 domain-containing protein [Chitinophagaceae bacterium]|nr:DUF1501 domain-containing protein [Chitinophagaceae bacterium]
MKRREFLGKSAAITLPALISGYAVKALNEDSPLVRALLGGGTDTDHVLVIIQLSGGNDGLNMVIPISTYDLYYGARSNIAIPQNRILTLNGYANTGLHPSMTGLQTMYNEKKLKVIQAVGYPQPNFSHFRATDIWMTASNTDQQVFTGWAGRYLNYEYPNFPTGYPNATTPDPLAIQIGSTASLTTQGPSVNMAMSITSATSFYQLINGTDDPVPQTKAGKELSYVRNVAKQTRQYASAIVDAANRVTNQSPYPTNNSLADQLKIVARLIKGGLKTKVYMVSFGGFDNHSLQTTTTDTTVGTHATLLGRVSEAIKAFQDDLVFLEIEDRVVGMTFSEFGRRIKSNSSVGTDHGAAAPLFVFGKPIDGGVLGDNPTIQPVANVNDNVTMQYDFRSIYSTLLQKWFCVPKETVAGLFPPGINNQLQDLPLIAGDKCNNVIVPNPSGTTLITNYPNPFTNSTEIKFSTDGGHTLLQIMDTAGRLIVNLYEEDVPAATTIIVPFDASHLPNGVYYARLQNGAGQQVRPMLKVR